MLDATVFERCFRSAIGAIAGLIDAVVALDGKTVCGFRDGQNTALHRVSAFATGSGLCLGQEGTRGKGHEIAAIKALLETLTLKGCIVTLDAIGCQTEIARKIVDQGGDYLLAVKEHPQSLAEVLREFFNAGQCRGVGDMALGACQRLGKDHGRIETRNHLWVRDLRWPEVSDLRWPDRPIRQHWPKLAGVGMVERLRETNGKASNERACYIGSTGIANAETFAKAVRSHRAVENRLHWVLDMTLREDDCRIRKGHAPQNLSALRKFALTSIRQDQHYPTRSLRSQRKTAERIADCRASVLGSRPRV